MSYYKYCFVPDCRNTSAKDAKKVFLCVPGNAEIRREWCEAVGYCGEKLPQVSHCCKDHFDLKNDLQNYMFWKEMVGERRRMRLKPGVIPRFCLSGKESRKIGAACEERDVSTELAIPETLNVLQSGFSTTEPVKKKIRMEEKNNVIQISSENIEAQITAIENTFGPVDDPNESDVSVQAKIPSPKPKMRSVFTQYECIRPENRYTQTESSHEIKHVSTESNGDRNSFASSDSIVTKHDSDSTFRLSNYEVASRQSSSESQELKLTLLKENMYNITKLLIDDNPQLFLGINTDSVSILHKIHMKTNITMKHIQIVLEKIRTDRPYTELAYKYSLSESQMCRIFNANVSKIAEILKNLIVWPSAKAIYRALPLQFRYRWAHVQSIIDCFEIQIEKPTDALFQTLTWSHYKGCNTAKYLISITPGGLMNSVSKGYGGRASDMVIVENSGYLDILPEGAEILADRGFKNTDGILAAQGCRLACPPSVAEDTTEMSAEEVLLTKKIASVRVHVERIIERLRDFKMLKAHAYVNHNMLKHLNSIVYIAAALVNLQNPIFK